MRITSNIHEQRMLVMTLHARDSLQRERSTECWAVLPDLLQCRLGKQFHRHFSFHNWFEESHADARERGCGRDFFVPEDKEALAAGFSISFFSHDEFHLDS